MSEKRGFPYNLDKSAVWTAVGAALLFSTAVAATLILPQMVESTWVEPTSPFQRQMYEVADKRLFVSTQGSEDGNQLQLVYHLIDGNTLLAFTEHDGLRIVAPPELEKYVTRVGERQLKLTSDLLMLREPESDTIFDAKAAADAMRQRLQEEEKDGLKLQYQILELYRPDKKEAFSIARTDGVVEDWVDRDYTILEGSRRQTWHDDPGVTYVDNPVEYRVSFYRYGGSEEWRVDPEGRPISDVEELTGEPFGFLSRKDLVRMGEGVYRAEGCWYCHTDQTRTLIQDVVLNGADNEPAPPSTASEYVYNRVTFPGTRRIGPDLSRVGVKRPSRDWHKAHFWSPKTESPGSIMPRFQHFFDDDPRGTSRNPYGVPNYKFEAIFQYLMTKGTRITAPTKAWWRGEDPIDTKAVIEGRIDPLKAYP